MTDLDWFCLLWVGGAVAYLTLLVKDSHLVERDAEEADGVGDARTLFEPVAQGRAAGVSQPEE